MKKKPISNSRAALKFGWLGLFIALGFTLFWPSIYLTTIIVNSSLGYIAGFVINFLFRSVKYRSKSIKIAK